MNLLIYLLGFISLLELALIIYLYISNWRQRVKLDNMKSSIEMLANEKAKVISMESIEKARRDAVQQSKSVITGKVYEQFAPYFPNFHYNPKDARFIGSPIDYIVFDGLSDGEVKSIYFIEIKSGKSKLTNKEGSIKNAIEKNQVYFETIAFD
ncbi:MAG: Holliday junction resolvase-like protein [Caldisphaera sp.]|nr:Holliday junction resolvase-like protein [Caldisphaera sp.]